MFKKHVDVVVVGGGIAGLTASALLAHEGYLVTLIEAHTQLGGCAGTFRRGPYLFDVGATQVAGLEPGGIHQRLFKYLKSPVPDARILDPGCIVDLRDQSDLIHIWHDPIKWEKERIRQFPGSQLFWTLCSWLHKSNWAFVEREPVLPIANLWDFIQLLKALRLGTCATIFFSKFSIADLTRLCGCAGDKRLKTFLDLQLQLYSQESSEKTAALYGSTVLQMAQEPRGLWHLHGSMQKLSDLLKDCFLRDRGNLLLEHRVNSFTKENNANFWTIKAVNKKKNSVKLTCNHVIFSLPPQQLLDLIPLGSGITNSYRKRLENLPKSTGALVFYGVLSRYHLRDNCPGHFQLSDKLLGSIFISISQDGDGRAPIGEATIIASAFTATDRWSDLHSADYKEKKEILILQFLDLLSNYFDVLPQDWLHKELATPRSFQRWTGRFLGGVGGFAQTPSQFGPFGLPSRTPSEGLWLCGDSIYPGEGTAGVSQSALMVCRQLMASEGRHLDIAATS